MWSREMKHFSFSIFYNKSKLCEKSRNYIVAIVIETEMNLCYKMKRPLSTKEKIEIGIFRFFRCLIWNIRERIGEWADSWLTPTSTLQKGEGKLFQRYLVFLPTITK